MNLKSLARTALLFMLFSSLLGCREETLSHDEPQEVYYSVVTQERITVTSSLPGRVSALVKSEVRPQVDGIILERLFEEGAEVVKGQVLYQIDPAVYQSAYNTAKANLEEARANVNALAMLEKRYRVLVQANAISRQDLDNAVADHGQARARIAKAEAELESAAINLAYTQIKAPVSGRIGASSVTQGALVTANQTEALAMIQQIDTVYVDFTQSSADTLRLRRAMAQGKMTPNGSAAKVRLTLEDGSPYTEVAHIQKENLEPKWILGNLLFSEVSVSKSTGAVSMRAIFSNPDALLLPGMYVSITIEEGAMDNALLIPQQSVLPNGSGGHFVYVLLKTPDSNTFFQVERRDVLLERSLGNRWIIKSGLSAGDLLVVEGLQKAVPGGSVIGTPVQSATIAESLYDSTAEMR